jgi:HAD superfamily hydrolase (TIGR01509 family)
LDDRTFRAVQGMRVADSARLFCERFSLPVSPAEAMAERDRLFLEAIPTRLRARPGLYYLLDELATREVPLAIGTSGHRRYLTLAMQTLDLDGRFRAVATGDEVESGKPAPDIYLLAAERLGVPPDRCLALEDAPLGVEAAVAAGMTCVAVPSQWTATLEFPGASWVFPSLHEVREALDDLLGCGHLVRYTAAGGVVVCDDRVLVLRRPNRGEVRLPKGHVEPGENVRAAALREVREESGYVDLVIRADLGAQVVEFDYGGQYIVRTERYFLMRLVEQAFQPASRGEPQFEPVWLSWDKALATLTFKAEREWMRRAKRIQDERRKREGTQL